MQIRRNHMNAQSENLDIEHRVWISILIAVVLTLTLIACSTIRSTGEYDEQRFASYLRAGENILMYADFTEMGHGVLLLTDERVIGGLGSWDYAEIVSVRLWKLAGIRLTVLRGGNTPYTVDIPTSLTGDRGPIKRLIRGKLEYVDQIRQEIKQRMDGVTDATDLNAAIMAELRRRRDEAGQKKRAAVAARFGTIGITTLATSKIDVKRECKSTSGGGATGTPLDVIILPIMIIGMTGEWIECTTGSQEDVENALTSLRQALDDSNDGKNLHQHVGTAAQNQLDNPIVLLGHGSQPGARLDFADKDVDTVLEVTPLIGLTKYGGPKGDSYGLVMKARLRIIDAHSDKIVSKEEFLQTGTASRLSSLSFTTALEAGYEQLAEKIAGSVLKIATD